MHRTAALLAMAMLYATPSAAHAENDRLISGVSGVHVGFGWFDDVGEAGLLQCVGGIPVEDPQITSESHSRRVQSAESLYRDLTISITARAKARFGGGSGGISASYRRFESTLSNSNRLNISLSYVAEQNPERLAADPHTNFGTNFRLLPEYRSLLEENSNAFYKACGDSFIVIVKRRSMATALFSSLMTSLENKQTIESSLGISGSYGPVSASTTISAIKNAISKKTLQSYNIDFTTVGTRLHAGANASLNSPDTLEEVEEYFNAIEPGLLAPQAYAVVVVPYTDLSECIQGALKCSDAKPFKGVDPAALYVERLAALQQERAIVRLDSVPLADEASGQYFGRLHQKLTGSDGRKLSAEIDSEFQRVGSELKDSMDRKTRCVERRSCFQKTAYDDLRLSLAIPVSRSAVPEKLKTSFDQSMVSGDVSKLRPSYAILLWYDRFLRPMASRCISGEQCIEPDQVAYLCQAFNLVDLRLPDVCGPRSDGKGVRAESVEAVVGAVEAQAPDAQVRKLLQELGYDVAQETLQ